MPAKYFQNGRDPSLVGVPIFDLANDSASSATSLIFTLVRVIR
jgi:hypothetical protein